MWSWPGLWSSGRGQAHEVLVNGSGRRDGVVAGGAGQRAKGRVLPGFTCGSSVSVPYGVRHMLATLPHGVRRSLAVPCQVLSSLSDQQAVERAKQAAAAAGGAAARAVTAAPPAGKAPAAAAAAALAPPVTAPVKPAADEAEESVAGIVAASAQVAESIAPSKVGLCSWPRRSPVTLSALGGSSCSNENKLTRRAGGDWTVGDAFNLPVMYFSDDQAGTTCAPVEPPTGLLELYVAGGQYHTRTF